MLQTSIAPPSYLYTPEAARTRRVRLRAAWMFAPALFLGAGPASAQAISPGGPDQASADTFIVTLAEAHRWALALSLDLLAQRQEIEVARGQRVQAGQFAPNPVLEVRAPGARTNGAVGEFEASLNQEIEVAGQRGLRIRAADLGFQRSEAAVEDAVRRTLASVNHHYFAALAAQRRLDVVTELHGLSQRLVEVTRIQAREGEISAMDANLAEIEAGRALARRLTAEREALTTRLELQRLIGIAPEQDVRLQADRPDFPGPATLDPDSLLALALGRRPDLVARAQAVEEYDALAELARREAIPNPRVGVFVEREERFSIVEGVSSNARLESPRLGLGISLPIPLFQRNQGLAAGQRARAEQARYEQRGTELNIRTEVIAALRAYRSADEEMRVFEQDVLLSARANQQLLEMAFQEGKIALPTMLLLRNQLLDAELGYWDAWLAARGALTDLQSATATLGIDTPDSIGDAP